MLVSAVRAVSSGPGEGVEVLLGGGDGVVPESFFDRLEIRAAGEHPGGVGVV
jgi:hypothetical protein